MLGIMEKCMKEKNWMRLISEKNQISHVIKMNQYTAKFGLSLSEEETKILINDRSDSLTEQRRIEFGEGILPKLIFTFCDSPYIYQENYVDTIGRLQDIFYLYKNESLDEVSDDELLQFMKEKYEGECQGTLDYLEETCLEDFARKIRAGSKRFMWGDDYE